MSANFRLRPTTPRHDAAILAIRREPAQPFAMVDRPREPKKAQRLAAALRENLKRRKAQAKERRQSESAESGRSASGTAPRTTGRSHDSAGIIEDK